MKYLAENGREVSLRAEYAASNILTALHILVRLEVIDPEMYRNDVARWLRLKADMLRNLEDEEGAVECERLILAQFSADVWEVAE